MTRKMFTAIQMLLTAKATVFWLIKLADIGESET
jgi:hypothetical protein